MKTMKHFVLAVALLTGALLALQGCDPQLTLSSDAGSDVTFKPSSGYPVTKTAYSGVAETVSGRKYERIDWVVGDVIRIYSPDVVQRSDFEAGNASDASLHWADYKVKSVTPRSEGSRYSDAKLDNASGNGLVCGKDYSLVSYDDLSKNFPMPPSIPAVTSIDYSRTAAGKTAAKLLIQNVRSSVNPHFPTERSWCQYEIPNAGVRAPERRGAFARTRAL